MCKVINIISLFAIGTFVVFNYTVDIKEEPSLRATYILIQELGQYMEAMNFHGSGPEEEYEVNKC